jgi:hypothetical protein
MDHKLEESLVARRKKSRTKRNWKLPKIPVPSWENFKRGIVTAISLAIIGGLVSAWIGGVPRLMAYAAEHNAPEFMEIHFSNPPAWVHGDLEELLIETVLMQIAGDTLNRDELIRVREALLNTGWFDSVQQVRRVHAERIDIDATFVDPYALIRRGDDDHLVDDRGRLLPRRFPAGAAAHFIVITGARFPPPGRPGIEWDGSDVIAALRLHRVLDQQQWRDQVRRIEVTGFVNGRPLRLITDRGSVIVWGSPPGEEAPLESLTDRKLAFLNLHYRNHGHIDGGHAGEIDITDHERVFKR